jgi:hypothetical protein
MQLIKYSELTTKFGQAGSKEMMVKRKFPFPLKLNGDAGQVCYNFYGNKYIADAVILVFQEILKIYGLKFIIENNLDWYGGCFENRKARGASKLSVHAWGMGVDYLPHLGRLGDPALIPWHVVDIFKKHGFAWGGEWDRPDGMHFSAVKE